MAFGQHSMGILWRDTVLCKMCASELAHSVWRPVSRIRRQVVSLDDSAYAPRVRAGWAVDKCLRYILIPAHPGESPPRMFADNDLA